MLLWVFSHFQPGLKASIEKLSTSQPEPG